MNFSNESLGLDAGIYTEMESMNWQKQSVNYTIGWITNLNTNNTSGGSAIVLKDVTTKWTVLKLDNLEVSKLDNLEIYNCIAYIK